MSLVGDMFLDFTILVDEFDGTICEGHCHGIAGSFAEGHPVVVDGVGVEF